MLPLLQSLLFGTALALAGSVASLPAQAHDAQAQRPPHRGPMAKARLARAERHPPEVAVAVDLRRLERIYRRQGDETAIVAMYRDLLTRADAPKLRAFAERRLRHAERVAHPERTIADLRARIDRKLAELR